MNKGATREFVGIIMMGIGGLASLAAVYLIAGWLAVGLCVGILVTWTGWQMATVPVGENGAGTRERPGTPEIVYVDPDDPAAGIPGA